MKKKKEVEKTEKSKKKERAAQLPPKPEANKWQEFLRRHTIVQDKKDS